MAVSRQAGSQAALAENPISQSWQKSSRKLEDLQGTYGKGITCLGSNSVDQAQRTFPPHPTLKPHHSTSWHWGGSWNSRKVWGCFSTSSVEQSSRLESKLSYREEKYALHRPEFITTIQGREDGECQEGEGCEWPQGQRTLGSGCGEWVWILLNYQISTAGRGLRSWFSAWAKTMCSDGVKWVIADQRDSNNKVLC